MSSRISLGLFGFFAAVVVIIMFSYNNQLKSWSKQSDLLSKNTMKSWSNVSDHFMERMQMRMDERRIRIQEICDKLGFHHDKNKIKKSLIYSTKHKTIFCQIPKTGITRWRQLFTEMNGEHFEEQFTKKFKEKFQLIGEERKVHLLKDDWLKMTVVREPMERLISAFRSKLAKPDGPVFKSIAESIHIHYGNKRDFNLTRGGLDFNTFINYLVVGYPNSLLEDNNHWKKYSTLCQPCDVRYDVIGHQETVSEDSKYVLKTIGAPPDLELGSAYQNKTDDDMVLRYYSTVKPRERVMQLYNLLLDDYLLFGYPPPPLLKKLFNN